MNRKKHDILRISNNSIQKLGFKAGVKSLDSVAYESSRGILLTEMNKILKIAVIYADYVRKGTISASMISAAATDLGMPNQWLTHKLKKGVLCETYETKVSKRKKSSSPKKRKFKPGTVATKKIKHYQKLNSCLLLNKSAVKDIAKHVASDYKMGIRFSSESLILLQYVMENYLVSLLKKANKISKRSGKTRVSHKDVELARLI